MAIGTSVKVGFDGEAVKRGFGGLKGMFGGIGRNFGRGMAMMGGAMAGRSLVDLVVKATTGMNALADFAGEAEDTALQTGSTTAEIIKLDRALQLAGANVQAGRMLSTLSDNLYDATHGGEELQNVFSSIGLNAYNLAQMRPMEQFMAIGDALKNSNKDLNELNNITEKLFGGKMGMQLIKLFKNQDVFDKAASDTGRFADNIEASQKELGQFSDQLQRIPYLWKSINLALFKQMGGNGNYFKKMFDGLDAAINAGDFSRIGYLLKAEFAKALEVFTTGDIGQAVGKFFINIGNKIGQGMMESLKGAIPGFGMPSWLGGKSSNKETAMLQEMRQTNLYLSSIERTNGTYA